MRNKRRNRLTVEKLGADCLDVRALYRAGIFKDYWVDLPMVSLRWPRIARMRAARYLLQLELRNQVVPQQIRVSWPRCHYGGARPWLHCPFCERRVGRLFKGLGGYFCRPCVGNPIYASQTKSTKGRRHFEACKLLFWLRTTRPSWAPQGSRSSSLPPRLAKCCRSAPGVGGC